MLTSMNRRSLMLLVAGSIGLLLLGVAAWNAIRAPAHLVETTPTVDSYSLRSPQRVAWSLARDSIGRIADVAVSPNSTIALLDAMNRRIFIVDSTGALQRSVGRRGSGPGEMLLPIEVAILASGWVAALDQRLRVLTWDPSGDPGPVLRPAPGVVASIAASSTALFLKTWLPSTGELRILRYDAPFLAPPLVIWKDPGSRGKLLQSPALHEGCAVCPFAVSDAGELALSRSPRAFHIDILGPDGTHRVKIERDIPHIPNPHRSQVETANRGRISVPTHLALIRGLGYDDEGALWVRRAIRRNAATVSEQVERYATHTGNLTGLIDTFDVPISAVRARRAFHLLADSSGVRFIVGYRLEKVVR